MTSQISTENTNFFAEVLEQLRNCSQVNIQSQWFYHEEDLDIATVMAADCENCWENWTPVQLNEKGNVSWKGGKKLLWLAQKVVVPQDLNGYDLLGLRLLLGLLWWADSAQVYVNGKLVVEGDLFDCSPRVLVSTSVEPGNEFLVALRLVSPGHCDGALVKSFLVYESGDEMFPEPGFVADELEVVRGFLEVYEPEKLGFFNHEVTKHTKEERGEKKEERGEEKRRGRGELDGLLRLLRDRLVELKLGSNGLSKVSLLGHAHLDMAWLWPVSETWNAAQSTFESVLRLQEDFSELVFCHSTPALYAWVEDNRPDLFAAIQQKVAEGVWEVLGGFWIEPELNLISGESLARQLLYGQRYVLSKFGKISPIVWVPDTFGFCWTLPQFMQQGGIEYFVTQKLRWNDTNKFPHGVFWWQSPDGSKVLSLMSAPVGEGIDAVKMASYVREWEKQTGLNNALWLPGVGDHGGGPTRDMLEVAQRWQKSPFFPKLEFTTAEKYLKQLHTPSPNSLNSQNSPNSPTLPLPPSPLPTWNDELYLEFHRGCYTTHGDQKLFNRRGENLLYEAELFAALSTIVCGTTCGTNYPKAELEAAWKNVLFNQFHDILPGSSITEVYQDSRKEWDEVERTGTDILQRSLMALASQINLPEAPQKDALPIFVFNSLNWKRSQVVSVELPPSFQQACIYNSDGEIVVSQFSEQSSKLLFLAKDVPSVGYRVFWVCSSQDSSQNDLHPSTEVNQEGFILENEFLQVTVDEQTGNLSSVFDKVNQREVLNGAGNELQAFGDSGQYWDAWNIDPNYAEHPLPPTTLKSIQYLEKGLDKGCVQSCIRVVRQLGNSEFCQDYILQVDSPLLKISTTVNWQETHVMVKAAFPLNLEADFATYEIPCGVINRPTKPETPTDKAKWEVPALRWGDIGSGKLGIGSGEVESGEWGVSLLNDCKYGYDAQPNQLRLTLLRSPKWPDPEADKGFHEFTYALYPHAGNWKTSHTTRHGYELNVPLQVIFSPQGESETGEKTLPHMGSFINLSANNLILMALKQSEDNPHKWLLRCYESHGETAELSLSSDLNLKLGEVVDLLERPTENPKFSSEQQNLTIAPWKITSFLLL